MSDVTRKGSAVRYDRARRVLITCGVALSLIHLLAASALADSRPERQRSRHAFSGLSDGESKRLAEARFGETVNRPPWNPAKRWNVIAWERSSALVREASGRASVLESTVPLTTTVDGRELPVSLELVEAPDGWASRRPLVTNKLPKDLRSGLGLPGVGAAVHLLDVPPETTGAEVDSGIFYADAGVDSDAIAQPVPGGLELLLQLRSERSPESFRFDVDLPRGAHLKAVGEDMVTITRGRDTLATIAAPLAIDSQGRDVPLTLGLEDDELTLEVPHRGRDLTYPLLVDPSILEGGRTYGQEPYYEGADWAGDWSWNFPWTFSSDPPGAFDDQFVGRDDVPCTQYGYGLCAQATYGNIGYGTAKWRSPAALGTSFIFRADFDHMWMRPSSAGDPWGYERSQNWCLTVGVVQPASDTYYERSKSNCGLVQNKWEQLCLGDNPCAPNNRSGAAAGTRGNRAIVTMNYGGEGPDPSCCSWAFVGGGWLFIHDFDLPYFTNLIHAGLPSGWVKKASPTVDATATDTGVGVKSMDISVPQVTGGPAHSRRTFSCNGSHASTCPATWQSDQAKRSWTQRFSYDTDTMPEGINTVGLQASDAIGNPSSGPYTAPTYEARTFDVKVDRTGPELTLGDDVWVRRDQADGTRGPGFTEASYGLDVSATDGSSPSGANARAGVARIDVQLLDYTTGAVRLDSPDPSPQACSASCAKPRRWELHPDDIGDGKFLVSVKAIDQAGNSTEKRWPITVERTPPELAFRGDLFDAGEDGRDIDKDGSADLAVTASDKGFGVRSVRIYVDNQRKDDFADQSCENGGCGTIRDFLLDASDYSPGNHTVRVEAIDHADRPAARSWDISIEDEVPAPNETDSYPPGPEQATPSSRGAKSCEAEGEPVNFSVYSLGPVFAGLPASATLRRCDTKYNGEPGRANYVSYIYGDCSVAQSEEESGCIPPVEVQSWPACERSLADYQSEPGHALTYGSGTIRGVPVASIDDGSARVEVFTGETTIVVFGETFAQAEAAANQLRLETTQPTVLPEGQLLSPVAPLPAPAPGATSGQLPCIG